MLDRCDNQLRHRPLRYICVTSHLKLGASCFSRESNSESSHSLIEELVNKNLDRAQNYISHT